jgi:DNA polymerase III subunit chi
MTRVDFYVSEDDSADARLLLACRITDKAYHLGHNVYIRAASPEQAERLDAMLWTFQAGSFLPHGLAAEVSPEDHPILVGCDDAPPDQAPDETSGRAPDRTTVFINLSDQPPRSLGRFHRVVELVGQGEAGREAARERWRYYREQGCALKTHTLP